VNRVLLDRDRFNRSYLLRSLWRLRLFAPVSPE
jgi:hypothetical protein